MAPPCVYVAVRACWLCSCVIACWLVVRECGVWVWALASGCSRCLFKLGGPLMPNTYGYATRAGSCTHRLFRHGGACVCAPPACDHARGWRRPSLGLANAPWLWA